MTEQPGQNAGEQPVDVRRVMQRADGYLDLKLWERARRELDKVPAERRKTLLYVQLLLRLSFGEEDWKSASKWAGILRKSAPNIPDYWIQCAYAVRRAHDIHTAKRILLEAGQKFPSEAVIPYNLACYACSSGDLNLTREYLGIAFGLEQAYRELAEEDEDLKTMWDELENIPARNKGGN